MTPSGDVWRFSRLRRQWRRQDDYLRQAWPIITEARVSAPGIVLAAGDTFRAAAIDQIKIHGERLGIRVVAQKPGSDPGAVLWDAIDAAKADGADLVIADTAGRMHTRSDLVERTREDR